MEEDIIKEIVKRVMDTIDHRKTIPLEVSARHVHLSQKHMEKLFGANYIMSKKKELSQPGQFQYKERVSLIGTKGVLRGVAILGPPRERTQVEISKTDSISLGIKPPIRQSGDLDGSESLYISTDNAVIKVVESVIIAKRHIHMTPEDAEKFNVRDNQRVSVRVNSERPVVFEDVVIRVSSKYKLNMHIDFDEGNAAGYQEDVVCEIVI